MIIPGKIKVAILIGIAVLALACIPLIVQLKFNFDFENFFPEGDEDLEFFLEFIDDFETDDNFLIIALPSESGTIFDTTYLKMVRDFSAASGDFPHVDRVISLTDIQLPYRTPFGIAARKLVQHDRPDRFSSDSLLLFNSDRFIRRIVDEKATASVVFIKTIDNITIDQSTELIDRIRQYMESEEIQQWHALGRAFFQVEISRSQLVELIRSTIISGLLVSIILFFLYRKGKVVLISLVSIALSMLFFLGFLGLTGRELSVMAALYPVIMIIVGTSDVIHITSKYLDEIAKGEKPDFALMRTVKEIGLATLMTSVTTAIGFASLFTSRIAPIREFGLNAAAGVLIAYLTVVIFTTLWLSISPNHQLLRDDKGRYFWYKWMNWLYHLSTHHSKRIWMVSIGLLVLCIIGITQISTNYKIEENLPRGAQVTEDFYYFEENFFGFRPFEVAIIYDEGENATDFKNMRDIDRLEAHFNSYSSIRSVSSPAGLYRLLYQMDRGDLMGEERFPPDSATYESLQSYARFAAGIEPNILMPANGQRARISSNMDDIGADSVKIISQSIEEFIQRELNTAVADFRITGTGVIVDKNAQYVRENLLQGLGLAVLLVSILMMFLFRQPLMLLAGLLPNLFPLLFAAALLGWFGIELEAGVSIVFAIVFGIAVDDSIHFLAKYRLVRGRGHSVDESILRTFRETGKALCLTTLVLFFGFLVLLFSNNPPTFTVGLLISSTLVSALAFDLLLIPSLLRWIESKK
nr:MMPL family transporter [Saprospiraceae bacterium]